MLNRIRTTNILLLVIVVSLIFYLLKILSFIFIPLIFSMFIASLFLPLMRWLTKYKVPRFLSIVVILLLIVGSLVGIVELIQLSIQQILTSDSQFSDKAEMKLYDGARYLKDNFGITFQKDQNLISQFFEKDNLGSLVSYLRKLLTTILMTIFFVVLWLAESINIHKLLNKTLLKKKHTSIKTFIKIENNLNTFIKVKFLVSFLTGIGTGLGCFYFDISFPIFWGLFAFIINFIQMVGSFITVMLLSIIAFVELSATGTLLFFIITISGVQVLFGAILEPIFMGKSFSINVIAVLVMLMFWGFLWGIPGLIMAIPITVFFKIILEQFSGTEVIVSLLSGNDINTP
jgi:AI-2 transport protein TqsA